MLFPSFFLDFHILVLPSLPFARYGTLHTLLSLSGRIFNPPSPLYTRAGVNPIEIPVIWNPLDYI
jgi:hypothetical protein